MSLSRNRLSGLEIDLGVDGIIAEARQSTGLDHILQAFVQINEERIVHCLE